MEVSQIDQDPAGLSGDEHGVFPVNGIDQENHPPSDAEIPEGKGDDTLLFAFGRDPLDQKTAEKTELPGKTHDQPESGNHLSSTMV
jgi:hypothetical protein